MTNKPLTNEELDEINGGNGYSGYCAGQVIVRDPHDGHVLSVYTPTHDHTTQQKERMLEETKSFRTPK